MPSRSSLVHRKRIESPSENAQMTSLSWRSGAAGMGGTGGMPRAERDVDVHAGGRAGGGRAYGDGLVLVNTF